MAYLVVFGLLIGLLLLTVGAYHIPFEKLNVGEHNLGWMNTAIALLIASVKASLVLLVFMHLRHSTRLTWVVATAGFLWLGIMILFFFSDYLSRSLVYESVRDVPMSLAGSAGTHANGQVLLQSIPDQVNTPGW